MDFASAFFSDLVEFAKSPEFGGEYASLRGPRAGTLGVYRIRWQNDQGLPRWEMLVPVFLPADGAMVTANPDFFGSLLLASGQGPDRSMRLAHTRDDRRHALERMDDRAAEELRDRCTELRHPNDMVLLAAADLQGG